MNNKILIITDRYQTDLIKSPDKDLVYELLTLGINGEVFARINSEKLSSRPIKILKIDAWSEEAQKQVRELVPGLIYRFPREEFKPGINLLKMFRLADGSNFWWFLEISEKGALRTPLIKRLYYWEIIKAALKDQNYKEIWLDLKDAILIRTLRSNQKRLPALKVISPGARNIRSELESSAVFFVINCGLRAVKEMLRVIGRRFVLRVIGKGNRQKLPSRSMAFFSFFPYFWIKSTGRGMIENFFREVPSWIKLYNPVGFVVWLSWGPLELWKNRAMLGSVNSMILMENYLKGHDFILVFKEIMIYLIRAIKYRLNVRKHIRVIRDDWDLTEMVRDELDYSLINAEAVRCFWIKAAIRQLTKLNQLAALVYRIEFQPHERALEYGARDNCRTIALQHQAIARNHLQYFFPKDEMTQYYHDKQNSDGLPLPYRFVVAGEYPYEVLRSGGVPAEALRLCGPLRYAGLINYLKNPGSKSELRRKYDYPRSQTIYLIATPSARDEMSVFMNTLLRVLKELESQDLFLFKSHPVFKHDTEIADMIKRLYPQMQYQFLADEVNLCELLRLSDALLLTGTTVGVEAICLGTVPILFDIDSTFSLNPLLEIKEACLWVKNAKELKRALQAIKDESNLKEVKSHWKDAIGKAFYDIANDPRKRFVDILAQEGILIGGKRDS